MAETVYGTHEESHVMSEKVQTLAASIYKEFERMIKNYDEDVVKELMPLVVGILENLDQTSNEKQEIEVEIELLRDDNEQLLTQYEREKQLRKGSEQKYLEMEDAVEGEKRELQEKVESLESIVRMLELKSKNAADHVSRLEDKEGEMKKEYYKLHERYTELFKTHMDYMERTKIIMGTDRIGDISNSPRNLRGNFQLPNLKPVNIICGGSSETPVKTDPNTPGFDVSSPRSGKDSNVSIRSELSELDSPDESVRLSKKEKRRKASGDRSRKETSDKEQVTDNIVVRESGTTTGKSNRDAPATTAHETRKEEDNEHSPNDILSNFQYSDIIDEKTETVKDVGAESHLTSSQSESELNDSLKRSRVSSKLKEPLYNSTPILSMVHTGYDTEIDRFEESLPGLNRSLAELVATTPELDELDESVGNENLAVYKPSRNNTSIFDELSSQDSHLIGDVDYGADITGREVNPGDYASSGMGKELENLILENTELLATKNALNIVKDDLIAKVDELTGEQEILREEINSLQLVRTKLQQRIKDLEDELKKTKEELENKNQAAKEEEGEDEIPMAQRKRFTRVEMARVLMERNQYKERLMELQEAVRWTEMIRASREHPDMSSQKQKKSSIWNFFSNLFSSSSSEKPGKKKPSPAATIKYSAPTTQVQPVGDPNKKERSKYNMGNKAKAYDFLQEDITTEKLKKEREKERREQYKQVRAHVKKDDGRMQAYGWSLPAKFQPQISREIGSSNKGHVPVPVPVYCRPLIESETGLKIWCAAGANLTGGKTRDGGSIVGASVFYSNPPEEQENRKDTKDEIEKLNQELKEHEKSMKDVEQMSSLLWICTGTNTGNRVNVIDANNPADVLDTIRVSTSPILCIASVPGALETDFPVEEEILKSTGLVIIKPNIDNTCDNAAEDNSNISGIALVKCATGSSNTNNKDIELEEVKSDVSSINSEDKDLNKPETDPLGATTVDNIQPAVLKAPTGSESSSRSSRASTPTGDSIKETHVENEVHVEDVEKISSVLPTMWIGTQSGSLYVHSAVTHWRKCIHSVKLKDSILGIVHVRGRVFVSLADGSVAIFHRDKDWQWDLKNYHILDLGCPPHSVRCMCVIAKKHVWCGYKNKIHVVDPQNMNVLKTFDAHPRKESQVRQMAWVGDGVWLSIRLDSTLRLYHAYTHQHLQDVDIEPYVSKMLGTGKLGFSFVRITAMLLASNRLWIGTGNGVIISIPLSEGKQLVNTGSTAGRPGGLIRVYSDSKTNTVTPGSFIPYCSMAQAQLSFHGHKDAVKFFSAVPGIPRKGMSAALDDSNNPRASPPLEAQPAVPTNTKLVISGGEGYVDFRIGDCDDDELVIEEDQKPNLNKTERSHLIVWQVTAD